MIVRIVALSLILGSAAGPVAAQRDRPLRAGSAGDNGGEARAAGRSPAGPADGQAPNRSAMKPSTLALPAPPARSATPGRRPSFSAARRPPGRC